MPGTHERAKKWALRLVVLTAIGVLLQVGFLVWRVRTPLGVPRVAGPVTVQTERGGREVLVKEYFGATDCISELFTVDDDGRVAGSSAMTLRPNVIAVRVALLSEPFWHRPWDSEEVAFFAPLVLPDPPTEGLTSCVTLIRLGVGFPFRAFTGVRAYHGMVDVRGVSGLLSPSGAQVSPGFLRLGSWELPIRPIWSGLLLNTAIVVVPLLAFLGARDMWRWKHRAHAGECPGCCYDLAGVPKDSPCPECGREPVV